MICHRLGRISFVHSLKSTFKPVGFKHTVYVCLVCNRFAEIAYQIKAGTELDYDLWFETVEPVTVTSSKNLQAILSVQRANQVWNL